MKKTVLPSRSLDLDVNHSLMIQQEDATDRTMTKDEGGVGKEKEEKGKQELRWYRGQVLNTLWQI